LADYILHIGIPTKYICRYILETIIIVFIHFDIVHGIHYIRVYPQNVFISILQRYWELCPFTLALFMVFITYGYIDKMCPSVYSKDYKKCSLLNAMIINDLLNVHFFPMKSLTEWKIINNMWKAFWIFLFKLKIFHLTLQTKSLMKI
jgi:hypothetical protein